MSRNNKMSFKIPWPGRKGSIDSTLRSKANSSQLLLEAGRILKERREEYGVSRSQLAKNTRITPSVLEAIENGWANKLPEEAYLCSMLSILEIELNLERKSLDGALKAISKPSNVDAIRRFNPGSINLFRSCKGSLLYTIAMFSSIYALNQQQRNLAILNSQTFEPIIPNINRNRTSQNKTRKVLEPGKMADRDSQYTRYKSNWVNSLFSKKQGDVGLLEIKLRQESNMSIKSGGGHHANFNKFQGNLKLKISTPIVVKIQPQPTNNDEIIWKGKRYIQSKANNGIYNFNQELNSPTAPSNERPQNIPRSP